MARRINEEGLALIRQWEGLKLTAYKCPAGVWTIGYGSTKGVREGMKITKAQAELRLKDDANHFGKEIEKRVKVSLTDNQFAALISLVYNIGINAFEKSTLLRKLNAEQWDSVPHEFMKWVKAKDPKTGKRVTLNGLVNRRAAEVGLWVRGAFVESSTTRAVAFDKPVLTKEAMAVAAGAVPAIGSAAASGDGPVQWTLAALMLILFGIAAFWYWNKRRNPK